MKYMKRLALGPFCLALALTLTAPPVQANQAATQMLNQIRADKGLGRVKYSHRLEKAAQAHLNDMVRNNFRSHTGSRGSKLSQRVKRAGYKFCYASENIAWGQRSLQSVMRTWVKSRGHYRNLVNRKAREFALVRGGNNVWVMVLGSRC